MYPEDMEWLNYHHLYYFWVVAKHGSIARAVDELRLAQPTISGQIKLLEDTLGEKLFVRAGRGPKGLTATEIHAVPEVVTTAAGRPVARLQPRAKKAAERSSMAVTSSRPAGSSQPAATASGAEREPGAITA